LVGFALLRGHFPQLRQQTRGQADGDQLLGHSTGWPSDPAHTSQLRIRGFRDIGKINLRVGNMLCAPCGSPVSR
jgi:hypothetical protein